MSYSEFTLSELQEKFQISVIEDKKLYTDTPGIPPSDILLQLLDYYVPLATAIDTEKARSEFIIAPILAEIRKLLQDQISIFSGIDFTVNPKIGLNGICDFIISSSPEQLYLKAPIITVVEAKNDRIKQGIPQCIAEMVASNIFNTKKGNPISTVYGVITTGSLWKFLQFHKNNIHIDQDEYHVSSIEKIIAIFLSMTKPQMRNEKREP